MTQSIVRMNLLTIAGYTPYCAGDYSVCRLPRLVFDGEQFKCPRCSYRTNFDPVFIHEYKTAQERLHHE